MTLRLPRKKSQDEGEVSVEESGGSLKSVPSLLLDQVSLCFIGSIFPGNVSRHEQIPHRSKKTFPDRSFIRGKRLSKTETTLAKRERRTVGGMC